MTTIDKLRSSGAANRLNGIMTCVDNKTASEEEINLIIGLKTDKVVMAGRMISDYAYAALDLLGIEKYSGDNEDIKDFIKALKG